MIPETPLRVAIIGYGTIGQAIKQTLGHIHGSRPFIVSAYDVRNIDGATKYIDDHDTIENIVMINDVIIAATPFYSNIKIFSACNKHEKVYIDLTEDVSVRHHVTSTNDNTIAFPACGLAPGVVSIIGANIVKHFGGPKELNIRVGALPLTTHNKLKYELSWSPEGLINEYVNYCEAIVDGQQVAVPPLADCEKLVVDGTEYEAFNTSGGIGTLCEHMLATHGASIKNVNYKTVRYQGHRELMDFLLNDLNFGLNQTDLVQLFKTNLPFGTNNDVVVIVVKAMGYNGGVLETRSFTTKVYGDQYASAIKKTTAAGVCVVLDYYAKHCFDGTIAKGTYGNETIDWEHFVSSPYSKVFLENAKY